MEGERLRGLCICVSVLMVNCHGERERYVDVVSQRVICEYRYTQEGQFDIFIVSES